MQAAQTKDFDQQIATNRAGLAAQDRLLPLGVPGTLPPAAVRVYFVHFVYFVHMWKSEKFTAYPHEKKAPVYFVHFSRKFFARGARRLPKWFTAKSGSLLDTQNIPKQNLGMYPTDTQIETGYIPKDTQTKFGYELGIRPVSPLDFGFSFFMNFKFLRVRTFGAPIEK